MKIPSVNISPRVQCGKTAGKTRVSVTQLNSKLHCGDFVRMAKQRPCSVFQNHLGRALVGEALKKKQGAQLQGDQWPI